MAVRVVRHVVPPANILVIYFGATLRHMRGAPQSHQSVITQVCKKLIAKDLSGKFLPGGEYFGALPGEICRYLSYKWPDEFGNENAAERGGPKRAFGGRVKTEFTSLAGALAVVDRARSDDSRLGGLTIESRLRVHASRGRQDDS